MKIVRKNPRKKEKVDYNKGITSITVGGFKSIAEETTIDIRPLTILAGANSSGKSSMIQPLLMMKQTLEESFDPGPLQIMGSLVEFTHFEQFFSKISKLNKKNKMSVSFRVNDTHGVSIDFTNLNRNIEIERCIYQYKNDRIIIPRKPDFNTLSEEIKILCNKNNKLPKQFVEMILEYGITENRNSISRSRCFLYLERRGNIYIVLPDFKPDYYAEQIVSIIHLPGLRGNPQRIYNKAAIGDKFPGNFNKYVASMVYQWQETISEKLIQLKTQLKLLGLTDRIEAKSLNDVQIEIRVSRLPVSNKSNKNDLVNIADVGVGVSQVLPVLVALLTAEEGQLVHLEQPELHLHPKAQVAMAEILADAAKQGVRVVVETHSDLLLLAIQTLVAEEKLLPDLVKLHWFERNPKTGITKVTSADLDEEGAYGNWPEDFGKITLAAESRYLDASEAKQFRKTS